VTVKHRVFIRYRAPNAGQYRTYCGRHMFDLLGATEDDRKVTCRVCLKAMGQREHNRLKWKELA
jgi:hypothetical protein